MTATATIRRRLHAQRLAGEPFATPAEAVAWSGAVQAQEHAEALWSLGMRVSGCDAADVQAACDRGEIVRTHVLRPTWHFVRPRTCAGCCASPARASRPGAPVAIASSASTPEAGTLRRAARAGRGGRRAAHPRAAADGPRARRDRCRRPADRAHPRARRARGRDLQRPAARRPSHVPAAGRAHPAGARAQPRGRCRRARAALLLEPRARDAARLRLVVGADDRRRQGGARGRGRPPDGPARCARRDVDRGGRRARRRRGGRLVRRAAAGHVRRGARRVPRPAQRACRRARRHALLRRPIVIDAITTGAWTRRSRGARS